MITRALYALAWWVALPLALARLWWRGRRQPGYRADVGERLGRSRPAKAGPCIWVHAVSVGETRAAAPLVERLLVEHPGHRVLLTHMTPTGRATGVELFGDRVERAWLPYDLGFAVREFLDRQQPALGIVMETEVWPRLFAACAERGVPLLLANARLSERSARRYARWRALARWGFGRLTLVAAQAEADAERFRALGAPAVQVMGNVKFDVAVPEDKRALGRALRVAMGEGGPVIVAGSTREGEEAALLDALAAGAAGEARLLVVPRHPQRFDEVAALASERGFTVARRSEGLEALAGARVVVGDTMGEMAAYYAAADVVVMGGSLLPYGSQNLIEACAQGVPVIVGPHTYNFEDASRLAIDARAAVRVIDAQGALRVAREIADDPARREAMGRSGEAFVAAHRGAVARLAALAGDLLTSRAPG